VPYSFRYFTFGMKKNQEVVLLAIENEDGMIDQQTLNEYEQLPLIGDEPNQDDDNLKLIPFDYLPWHKRPSVSFLPIANEGFRANRAGRYIGSLGHSHCQRLHSVVSSYPKST